MSIDGVYQSLEAGRGKGKSSKNMFTSLLYVGKIKIVMLICRVIQIKAGLPKTKKSMSIEQTTGIQNKV